MQQNTAKDQLLGLTLPDGWKVVNKVPKAQNQTGGQFSTGYIVESPAGDRHFLKAIDYSLALASKDPARVLQALTEGFNLERDILNISKRLSHVVQVVADGTVSVTPPTGSPEPVQYLVLELAEESLRQMVIVSKRLPMSIGFTALHNVANGLRQLAGGQIAHQDMKPSNVLKFPGDTFKVCDLGRASLKGRIAPHDHLAVAGDQGYAPPELLYGQVHPEFVVRRWGCDAYLLGSLAAFLVSGVPMTALLIDELHTSARPKAWNGTYAAVLPQVRAAFARAMDRIALEIAPAVPYREELLLCIRQLCDPDPVLRGHPQTRATLADSGNVYDLERYVSIFDRLGLEARIHERKVQQTP